MGPEQTEKKRPYTSSEIIGGSFTLETDYASNDDSTISMYSDTEKGQLPNEKDTKEKESDSIEFGDLDPKTFSLRKRIHYTCEYPKFSRFSFVYFTFQAIVIVVSVVCTLIGTYPRYWLNGAEFLTIIEIVSISIFTFDYLIRLCTSGPRWYKWMINPYSIIDIISILPFYIELILDAIVGASRVSNLSVLRILRLLRILRILKLGKQSETFPLVLKALKKSIGGFILLANIIAMLLTISSSAMFFAEQTIEKFDNETLTWHIESTNDISFFQSIPETFWWCFVTITTVGYGDTYPKSILGKVVGCLTMLCALILLALPIIFIGTNFSQVVSEWHEENEIKTYYKKKKEGTLKSEDVFAHQLRHMAQQVKEIQSAIDLLKHISSR